ncbi:MAG: hypothetical protein WC455_22950, partial [Dehalococcoidia bacterium]
DGARPSADTMYRMAVYLWKTAGIDNAHIFHCPQTTDVDCLVETFKAISKAHKEVFGKWPDNYGKVVYVPPAPVPEPEPVPEPTPVKCNCVNWLSQNKPDIWRFLLCVFGGKKRCK